MLRTLDGDRDSSFEKQKRQAGGRVTPASPAQNSYRAGRRLSGVRNAALPGSGESGPDRNTGGSRLVRGSVMSLGTVVFMLGIIALITTLLIYYITIQAEVKRTSQEIAEMEEELTQIRAENDAAYNEINDSISLDEVRERAIHELGMKYANRDQVVIYSTEEKDTVHQVMEAGGQ